MALAFVLSLLALSSLLLVLTLPKRTLYFATDGRRKRSFKGHGLAAELKVTKVPRGGMPSLALVEAPEGVEAEIEGSGERYTLSVSSKFAGAFKGVKVKVGVADPLGVFTRYEVRQVDTFFEFLPVLLVQARTPMLVSAAMLGDYPAGRTGFGQEFYSAEEYTKSHSSKDIMWKREAKFPSDKLYVRVGEANNPGELTVYFIEKEGRRGGGQDRGLHGRHRVYPDPCAHRRSQDDVHRSEEHDRACGPRDAALEGRRPPTPPRERAGAR
ncbi:MAG: hypothetical protein JRN08_07345 [Nitrososphaerota archaeon]|nr:hypothetical protein [Nitrososphaerota archaeon]